MSRFTKIALVVALLAWLGGGIFIFHRYGQTRRAGLKGLTIEPAAWASHAAGARAPRFTPAVFRVGEENAPPSVGANQAPETPAVTRLVYRVVGGGDRGAADAGKPEAVWSKTGISDGRFTGVIAGLEDDDVIVTDAPAEKKTGVPPGGACPPRM